MKKIIAIFFAFTLLASIAQSPCLAQCIETTCQADSCCSVEEAEDAASATEEQNEQSEKGDCCIMTVLCSPENIPEVDLKPADYVITNEFPQPSLPGKLLSDFWQPPRIG